jgi:hypothetical protein
MRTLIAGAAVISAGVLASLGAWAQPVMVTPASPRSQETVRIQVPQGVIGTTPNRVGDLNNYSPRRNLITMAGNRITVSVELQEDGFGLASNSLDLALGQFPAGIYDVELKRRLANGADAGVVGATQFTVSQRLESEPQGNFSDLWWNPAESGWGINIIQHGTGPIFATWFMYGADGKPTWYVVPGGQWASFGEFRGQVYRTTGPAFPLCTSSIDCDPPFNPASVTVQLVGQAVFGFITHDSTKANVTLIIDGRIFQKSVERQPF